MHSIFEGVANHHFNLLFHYIIDSEYITLTDINVAIKSHPYGYTETETKPRCTERESFTSDFTFNKVAILWARNWNSEFYFNSTGLD